MTKVDDLIERLRKQADENELVFHEEAGCISEEDVREAADEIERLHAEVEALQRENAELRAAIERHRDCNPDVPVVRARVQR